MNLDDPSELGAVPSPVVAPEAAATKERPKRALRLVALVTLTALGLAGVLGGGLAMKRELNRGATKTEIATALAAEIASRWERLPAGTIFPPRIPYADVAGNTSTATLVGIAPATACRDALEPAALTEIGSANCRTMLRATYVSAGGMLAATVGVAVLPSPASAGRALASVSPLEPGSGMYAVPFAGTIANAFTNMARGSAGVQVAGPYLVMYTAGYTDGLPGRAVDAGHGYFLTALGNAVMSAAEKALTSHGNPCSMRDISC
jgi:hypothetical protein